MYKTLKSLCTSQIQHRDKVSQNKDYLLRYQQNYSYEVQMGMGTK